MKLEGIIKKIDDYRYKTRVIIAVLFLAGFIVRLYRIDAPIADWHSFRQADTASVSRMYAESGKFDLFNPKYHDISRIQSGIFNPEGYRFVEFPLYNFFHAVLARYIGVFSLEVWGRLISIIAALISAWLILLIGRKYISAAGGLIAAGFYPLNPYNIYFTRVILPEPTAVVFALFSLYLFIKFLEKEKATYLYTAAIAFTASILIKPYTLFYGVPIFLLAYEKYKLKGLLTGKKFWISYILALLPFMLWRLWIIQHPEGIPFWKWTLNGDGIRFKPAFWHWIFGERLTQMVLGYWGLLPFAYGLINYEKKSRFIHAFLFGMFLFVTTFATANVRHDYYQSITVPAIALMFSYGFIKLWNERSLSKRLTRAVLVFSSFMVLVSGAFQVKEFYKINHPEIIAAGEAVDRLTPKDSIVIAQYFGDTAFLYQTKRRGYPNVELPIDELIEEGAGYYASVDLQGAQTKGFMARFEILEKTDQYVILELTDR